MLKKLDHVTFVVKDLDAAIKTFDQVLYLAPLKNGPGAMPECRIAMLPTAAGARIELIEPNTEMDTRFTRWLNERGEGVFGLSMFIDNFDEEVARLRAEGVTVEDDFQGNVHPDNPFRIGWIPPTEGHGVWIELVDWAALPDPIKNAL